MYVVGGAAIALAFDERRSTRDIDAVFEPKSTVYEAAAAVAEQRGLPGGWLNDAVKGFLAGEDPCPSSTAGASMPSGLSREAVGAEGPCPSRRRGRGGRLLLARTLGLDRADQVLEIAERTYGDRLDAAARFFVEQLFESD